jgi:biofilm PGA synthesis N-glycosyltransferase PgaC
LLETTLKILFWFLVFLIINTYLLYPLVIWLLSKFKSKSYDYTSDFSTSVSILISAYNEEKVIENRVKNLLSQNYDKNLIEIIVGSDCSNDNTNEILKRLAKEYPEVKIFLFKNRRGKAGVLNEIVQYATNEILIFTDANTEFENNAIKNLVKHFQYSSIGGVSGRLVLIEKNFHKERGVEEKKYWEYETFIKKSEGNLGILIGANGGIFAIRKNLFSEIPTDKPVTDDFYLSLSVIKKGYKFIYESFAIGFEEVAKDLSSEFKRKVRFAATNFQTISFFKSLLFNKNIILSYAFWSHKIIRWFLPLILILVFVLNIFLVNAGTFYLVTFIIQLLFYFLALIGFIFNKIKIRLTLLSLIYYFLVTNIALLIGFIRFLRKKHSVIWQSTSR